MSGSGEGRTDEARLSLYSAVYDVLADLDDPKPRTERIMALIVDDRDRLREENERLRKAMHVPQVAERRDGTMGVFCAGCSWSVGDYVYPCREGSEMPSGPFAAAADLAAARAENERLTIERDEAYSAGFEQVRRRCVAAEAALAEAQAKIAKLREAERELVIDVRRWDSHPCGCVTGWDLAGDRSITRAWCGEHRRAALAAAGVPVEPPKPERCEHGETEPHQIIDEVCEWADDCPSPAATGQPEPGEEER